MFSWSRRAILDLDRGTTPQVMEMSVDVRVSYTLKHIQRMTRNVITALVEIQ